MTQPTWQRIAPGFYLMTLGDRVVEVTRYDHLDPEYGQWVVAAQWDRLRYSDPIYYLREARESALLMLEDFAEGC